MIDLTPDILIGPTTSGKIVIEIINTPDARIKVDVAWAERLRDHLTNMIRIAKS